MKWRELPECDREAVAGTLRTRIEALEELLGFVTDADGAARIERRIAAHESAIAALEEAARGHGR